jgi:putative transcriptional regulator
MKNLVGNLLIAPPSVKGNFFQKTVVLLTEHHSTGSVGLVLNKASKVNLKEFAKQNGVQMDVLGFVHVGGPVNVKALTMLHTNDWACDNTLRINDKISISSSQSILTKIAMGQVPKQWRIFVGLCAWTKGQLQSELEGSGPYDRNLSWLTATANLDFLFDFDGSDQWTESIELAGSEFAQNLLA